MISPQLPYLKKTPTSKQLIVHGKPFLMLAAELQNSALSSAEYMRSTAFPRTVGMNINTLLGSVTWEMIEPEEGKFDFTELDKVIRDARAFGMKLVLLWFGSFKNGISTYTPAWLKMDEDRFPRAQKRLADGILETADVISLFDERQEANKADQKAFRKLMGHLKQIDEHDNTVIMVQVENEIGLLGSARDGNEGAEKAFHAAVPDELVQFLEDNWETLHKDLRANLSAVKSTSSPFQRGRSWEKTFGASKKTDELFMAYHYAKYVEPISAAGKAAYNLPLYTNVWMNYVSEDADNDFPTVAGGGGEPGDYPSGGAVSDVFDLWMHFAPSLDFIAPDLYLNDYSTTCARYRHHNQPLFIPEQRRDEYGARRIWTAYASYQALGVSPFGIDTLTPETCAFTKHYGLLSEVSEIVLEAQRRPGHSAGFYFDEIVPGKVDKVQVFDFGQFEVRIERCFVFGVPGPGAGMIIHIGGAGNRAKFLLIGWGFQAVFKSLDRHSHFTGILGFKEKRVVDKATGELETLRTLGGDETRSGAFAMMPNEDPDYGGFPICVTIPARTMIAEVEVYSLERKAAVSPE